MTLVIIRVRVDVVFLQFNWYTEVEVTSIARREIYKNVEREDFEKVKKEKSSFSQEHFISPEIRFFSRLPSKLPKMNAKLN